MAKKRKISKTPTFGNEKIFGIKLWKFYMLSLEDTANTGPGDTSVDLFTKDWSKLMKCFIQEVKNNP